MEWIKQNSGKTIFAVILIVVLSLCIWHYCQTTSHFQLSCERICAEHKELCKQLSILSATARQDSVVVINANDLIIIQSSHSKIEDTLKLQHGEIQEDFSSLMLWASVLMVIFLVFSIYSMYRVDDLVNQCRSSASTVTDLSNKAEQKLEAIDTLFQSESLKLKRQTAHEIQELKNAETVRIAALEQDIEQKSTKYEARITDELKRFNKTIDAKSTAVLEQFETIKSSIGPLAKLAEVLRSDSESKSESKSEQEK